MSKIIGIKYVSPCLDNSGYAKAARGYILALHALGVPLTIVPLSFENNLPDLGKDGETLKSLINKDIDYNVVIIHSTPEFYEKYREERKLNIGYTIWECTKLHKEWSDLINGSVDKLMVATEWNVEVFKESGVIIPVCSIPHIIEEDRSESVTSYNISNISKGTYVYGFVGQWVERKAPLALLKAYWYAFQNNEDVALVLKTYRSNYSEEEKEAIRQTIKRLKYVTKFDNYPKIYFISDMLTEDEMRGLFKRFDCYVSLDRGEGWGLGHFQAGAAGKPVIATGFGGATGYLKAENSYRCNYTLTPVFGMPYNRWMTADMLWAEPDVFDGANKMSEVYNNQGTAKEKGIKLKKHIYDNFNRSIVGEKIIKEIEEVL